MYGRACLRYKSDTLIENSQARQNIYSTEKKRCDLRVLSVIGCHVIVKENKNFPGVKSN